MNKPVVLSLLSALMSSLCLLAVAAPTSADNLPMQGRRGTFRPDWRIKRQALSQNEQDRGPGGDYFTGEKHQLVILASFRDNPFLGDSAATLALWDRILNTEHLDEAPFFGSLHDYFYDQSYGRFNLMCDLQYVSVDSCRRYGSTYSDDENSQYLVLDIIQTLKQRDIEWDRYDWNGDGYVNQLLIIYAGQGSKYGNLGTRSDAIWPHQWWLSMHYKDRQTGVYCDPDTARYQGKDYILDSYCAVQEIALDSTYGAFGTLCHEYSHCFGFPDFYAYSTPVLAEWDIMDYGNYNGNGFLPSAYSAHERWLMGWLTPVELTEPVRITDMPALTDEPTAYIIRNDAYPSEYYLLENRQKQGWDAALPGAGLIVYHIDYDPDLWLDGNTNTYNTRHCTIIPANNKNSRLYSSGWAYPYADGDTYNDRITDTSMPAATLLHGNTGGEKLMSKPITDITVQDGFVSFSFMSPAEGLIDQRPTTNDERLTYKLLRNGQILIRRGNKTYTLQGMEIR